jgi:hypothetical protein
MEYITRPQLYQINQVVKENKIEVFEIPPPKTIQIEEEFIFPELPVFFKKTFVPVIQKPLNFIFYENTASNKIVLITPCSRPENIPKIMKSINFEFIHEWIIVYDGKNIDSILEFDNPKIKQYIYLDETSIRGNAQRNFALKSLENYQGYIYFLDDDNYIHPSFYKLINHLEPGNIYTFNQENKLKGNKILPCCIDTAMFLIDFDLMKGIEWKNDVYEADGLFISEIYNKYPEKWIYVNNTLCYYNKIMN